MFKIKNKIINKNSPIYTIAEIGVNHNGSIGNAIKMINYAKEAGFNAVKFQTFYTKEMLIKNTSLAKYQRKTRYKNMKDMLDKYNLSYDEFEKLKKYCSKKNITFLSTPFDIRSAIFLNKIRVPAFKISSGDLNNFHLLSKIKQFKKPIILSTGMATKKDLIQTINFLKLSKQKLAILHCISDYPTKIENTFLSNIKSLKKTGYTIGFSDHTVGDIVSCSAITLGAKIIEKHITLNKNMKGPDHSSSLECKKLEDFIFKIKSINQSINSPERTLTREELVTQKVAQKSLYFFKDLQKNHKIKFFDIIAMRPLKNGIQPKYYKSLIGKKLKKNVGKYTLVKEKYLKK